MLNIRALLDPKVGVGLLGTTATFYAAYAAAFVAVQYLALTHGLTPLQIGAMMLTYGILLIPLTFASARLAGRLGAGPMAVAGLLVIGGGDLLYARLDAHAGLVAFAVASAVFGGGMGLVQSPATDVIVRALPLSEQGLASAVNDLTREVGAALGLAVAGSVLTAHLGASGDPGRDLMAAWVPICVALAASSVLFAFLVLALHRRAIRVPRRRGRHAAPRHAWITPAIRPTGQPAMSTE